MKFFLLIALLFSSSFAANKAFLTEHFRILIGESYANDQATLDIVDLVKVSAQKSWQVVVDELGFIPPAFTTDRKIDIYLADTNARDREYNVELMLDDSTAGYTTTYNDTGDAYLVINSYLTPDVLQVTVAHEFFHLIQFHYLGDINSIPDDQWYPNIWWLEATAVLVEDEVYDEVDDYLYYIDDFFDNPALNIETYDGWHEYAMVIYAKYFLEKYGLDLIKKTFESFDRDNTNFFSLLDTLLQRDYNSSIAEALSGFTLWVAYSSDYFEEGSLYPNATLSVVSPQRGGIAKLDTLSIKEGWNLVSLPQNVQLPNGVLDDLLEKVEVLWTYDQEVWNVKTDLVVPDYYDQMQTIYADQGFWVKANKAFDLPLSTHLSVDTRRFERLMQEATRGWYLVGTDKDSYITEVLSSNSNMQSVWSYDNGVWKTSAPIEGYESLDQLKKSDGFWVYIKYEERK
jgi:hypothetical protein